MGDKVAEFSGQRGAYPRPSSLSVLAPHADTIRVYNPDHVSWCVDQFLDADPSLGGEETLDADLSPGVSVRRLAAVVPPEDYNAGAGVITAPGEAVGPINVWMKSVNTADGFGGLRGRSEWLVPADCAREDCCVLFLHGGSYQWYSGVDQYYRPLASRIATASGMPVLAIDYRLAPEFQHPDPLHDALDALRWMADNGPSGPRAARKIFVAGDSSGGGMCLALMLAAKNGIPPPQAKVRAMAAYAANSIDQTEEEEEEEGDEPAAAAAQPEEADEGAEEGEEGEAWVPVKCDGAVAICPLTDLSYDYTRGGSGEQANSYLTRLWEPESRTGDPIFTASLGNLEEDRQDRIQAVRTYAGEDTDLREQLLSPLWAPPQSLAGLPPCMLLAADEDLTVDDSVEFAERASAAGVEVDLVVWPRVWHCWVMCTEGRDMYGTKPGGEGFTGPEAAGFGELKEAVVALELVGTYLQALAERADEPDGRRSRL